MTALTRGPALRRPAADAWPVAAFIVFVVAWKLVVVLGRLPVFILPAPEQVAARFVTAWTDGTMAPHAWTTIVEVALGFAVGAVAGVVAGYGLARSSVFERVLSPYLVAAQAVPILALAPLLAVWFGPGLLAKVVICGLIVFFPVAVATMVGIRSVDRGLLELARSLVGEWAGADKGLGVLVNLARGSLFDIPLLFATLVTIALLGIACYALVVIAERRFVGLR